MRLPGRPPLPAYVVMAPTTTFLCRDGRHHDKQVTVGRAAGLGVTSPATATSVITASFHDFRSLRWAICRSVPPRPVIRITSFERGAADGPRPAPGLRVA